MCLLQCVVIAGGEETGSDTCDKGFTGMLCTVCKPGFFKSNSAGCIACNDNGINVVAMIGMFIGLVAVLYVFVLSCGARFLAHCSKQTGLTFFSKSWRSKSMNFRARKKNFLSSENNSRKYQSKIKQIVTMFQILSALPSTLSLSFPPVYYQLTFIFNLVNLDAFFNDLGLSCSVEGLDYISAVIAATLIPIVASLLLYFVQLVHVTFILHQYSEPFREIANTYHRIKVLKSTYFYVFLFFTYLVLPGVSTMLFGMLRPCVDMDPDSDTTDEGSHFYLEADYSIECSSARYDFGVVWAAVFVMVYPVGIPCMYFYLLYEAKGLIIGRATTDVEALDEAGLQEVEKAAMSLSSLRFLYQEYQPKVINKYI
jgi:hypothetical protein